MGQSAIKPRIYGSVYSGQCFVLTTKHSKSIALQRPLEKILGAGVLEYAFDTDALGTFSGEIQRKGSALESARKKCELGIKGACAEYALASEGSFGPHALIPFLPANREILYFIDRVRKFHLHISDVTSETNYGMKEISSLEELHEFAKKSLFSSHALIVRPFPRSFVGHLFKGVTQASDLEAAFLECARRSPDHKVWVETDMRAHLNPTRMKFIERLGEKLASRLLNHCPDCATPGWGKVGVEAGLPCLLCGMPTDEIQAEIHACAKCKHQQTVLRRESSERADPTYCGFCNP